VSERSERTISTVGFSLRSSEIGIPSPPEAAGYVSERSERTISTVGFSLRSSEIGIPSPPEAAG
jgi:hypothetical protein